MSSPPPMAADPAADQPRPKLGAGTRTQLRAKHTVRLVRELARHGREQQLWWLLPAAVVMVMFALAIVTTSTVVPVAVYTLF